MGSGHKDVVLVGAQEHGSASAEPQPSTPAASNQKLAARPPSFATLRVSAGHQRTADASVVQWASAESWAGFQQPCLMTHAEAVGGLVATTVTAMPCHRRWDSSHFSGVERHCGKLGVGIVEREGAVGRARRPHHTVASVAMRHRRHRMVTHGR